MRVLSFRKILIIIGLVSLLAYPSKSYSNRYAADKPHLAFVQAEKQIANILPSTSFQIELLPYSLDDIVTEKTVERESVDVSSLEFKIQRLRKIHVVLGVLVFMAIFQLIYSILTIRKIRKKNRQIEQANADLNHLNLHLESIVEARTKDLEKALASSQESDRLKTAFLANMSHEVRTPLNGLLGFARLLDDDTLPPHIRKQYIDIMLLRGNSLTRIINDIISIAQIEAGQMEVKKTAVNVNKLLTNLFTLFDTKEVSPRREGVKLNLIRSLSDTRSVIITDPIRLEQILFNLIDNALKFTFKGEVEFGYQQEGGKLLKFFVRDTGVGIPHEMQSKMFTRFNRDDNPYISSASGNGLGLSIAKGLVELLEGKIWFDTTLGEGTTFYFTIPYCIPNETAIEQENSKIESFDFSDKVILVVEDDLISFQLIEALLKDTGAKLIHAKNGEDAVEICQLIKDIDLVVMDMRLPFLNGYEATSRIKKINPSLTVIAQTANVLSDDRAKCISIGCSDYIPKPIDPDEFLRTIAQHLHDSVSNKPI